MVTILYIIESFDPSGNMTLTTDKGGPVPFSVGEIKASEYLGVYEEAKGLISEYH
jgi:hypothetical protein